MPGCRCLEEVLRSGRLMVQAPTVPTCCSTDLIRDDHLPRERASHKRTEASLRQDTALRDQRNPESWRHLVKSASASGGPTMVRYAQSGTAAKSQAPRGSGSASSGTIHHGASTTASTRASGTSHARSPPRQLTSYAWAPRTRLLIDGCSQVNLNPRRRRHSSARRGLQMSPRPSSPLCSSSMRPMARRPCRRRTGK